jgi:antirestriction protein ArdC
MAGNFDAQKHVTDRIIAAMEAGTPPWRKPWTGGGGAAFPYRACGEPYRGINVILLWLEAHEKGYASRFWFTYRQAQALGGQVRKGEKSASVIKFGTFEKEGATPEEDRRAIPYTKLYAVFSADQIDGLPEQYYRRVEPPRDLGTAADPALEAFFAATGAVIESTPDPRAYYCAFRRIRSAVPTTSGQSFRGIRSPEDRCGIGMILMSGAEAFVNFFGGVTRPAH